MIQTHPVIVAGRLLGAAVAQEGGWSFIAADPLVADLHGQRFPSPAEACRIAGLVLDRARAIPPAPPWPSGNSPGNRWGAGGIPSPVLVP